MPHHALRLLDGCSPAQLGKIAEAVAGAISIGAPLYNQGSFEACFRIYQGTALEVKRSVPACAGPKSALLDGVKTAAARQSWVDKAWAMRDAFDGLLEVIERRFAQGRGHE